MPCVGSEHTIPASEQAKTVHASDRYNSCIPINNSPAILILVRVLTKTQKTNPLLSSKRPQFQTHKLPWKEHKLGQGSQERHCWRESAAVYWTGPQRVRERLVKHLLSSKIRPHFTTCKSLGKKKKESHESRKEPKPRLAVLAKDSSNSTDRPLNRVAVVRRINRATRPARQKTRMTVSQA
jgi:hypothetical protein